MKYHRTSTKALHHPTAGDLEVIGEALDLPSDPGLRIVTYTVEPDSPLAHALAFLAS